MARKSMKPTTMFSIKTPKGETVNRFVFGEIEKEKQRVAAERAKERWLTVAPDYFPNGLIVVEE